MTNSPRDGGEDFHAETPEPIPGAPVPVLHHDAEQRPVFDLLAEVAVEFLDGAVAAAGVAAGQAEARGGDRVEHPGVALPEAVRYLAGVLQAVLEHGVVLDAAGVVDGDQVAQPVKVLGLQRGAVTHRGESRVCAGLHCPHTFSRDPDSNLTKSLTGALPHTSSPRPLSLACGYSRLSEYSCGAPRWPIGSANCPSRTLDTRCCVCTSTVACAANLRIRRQITPGAGIGGKGPPSIDVLSRWPVVPASNVPGQESTAEYFGRHPDKVCRVRFNLAVQWRRIVHVAHPGDGCCQHMPGG